MKALGGPNVRENADESTRASEPYSVAGAFGPPMRPAPPSEPASPLPSTLDPELLERYAANSQEGVCWSRRSDELDVNLVAWSPDHGVGSHVNSACDVLLVGLRGRGDVTIGGRVVRLEPGNVLVVPRGVDRAIRAQTRLLYLTCHRRQPGTFRIDDLLSAPNPVPDGVTVTQARATSRPSDGDGEKRESRAAGPRGIGRASTIDGSAGGSRTTAEDARELANNYRWFRSRYRSR